LNFQWLELTIIGGFYDFTADLNMKDTAYTNLELPAHTDTTYFTDPARLQAFHVLSHTDGNGGETLLVDGNYIASQLWKESKEDFFYLAKTKVPWHASGNEGINITPMKGYPVLNLEEPLEETAEFSKWLELVRHKKPEVFQIRWNNDDRATMPMTDDYEKWVIAARHWNDILTRPTNRFWTKLTPGRVLSA
jgi:trimethyllysine dioxygenase